jgi:hypothetical protein
LNRTYFRALFEPLPVHRPNAAINAICPSPSAKEDVAEVIELRMPQTIV